MEKTAAKQAKKDAKRKRKEGGEDVNATLETLGSTRKVDKVTISKCEAPSPRCNLTFLDHPSEDKLIFYGGEFFDGGKHTTFGDFFFYHISKQEWSLVEFPTCPLPRNSHQAVSVRNIRVLVGEILRPPAIPFADQTISISALRPLVLEGRSGSSAVNLRRSKGTLSTTGIYGS